MNYFYNCNFHNLKSFLIDVADIFSIFWQTKLIYSIADFPPYTTLDTTGILLLKIDLYNPLMNF